jgi:nucleotide-binding universal stress UspA family protein
VFTNVLVGVDRESGGKDAVALAKKLLAPGGELTLANVYSGNRHAAGTRSNDWEREEHEQVEEFLAGVCKDTGVEANLRWRDSSSIGRGLHELCELVEADLLVVGSSHRGLIGRVLIGDHTRAALNGAPCAIAIAPAGYAAQAVLMREIGVGYNGSAESDHAVLIGRKIAAEHGARLSAFEAVSLPTYTFLGGPAPVDHALEDLVDDARTRIEDLGGVEAHAVYGQPAEELALFSASVDLLIVGSRDYGPVGRVVHGSTSSQLAHTARCPLLVLTRAARAADQEESDRGDRVAAPE